MKGKKNFIFYDGSNKRWLKIKRLFLFLSLALCGLVFTALGFYHLRPVFGPSLKELYGKTPLEVVDEISSKVSDKIMVEGEGPILELVSDNGLYLKRQIKNNKKLVLLTFDDGPDPYYTPQILDVLKRENVKAVFFVVGEQLLRHPNLAKRIISEGHELGVHTYSHPSSEYEIYSDKKKTNFEIDFTQKIIQAQTGLKTKIFRPPYWGKEDNVSLDTLVFVAYAFDKGYKIIPTNVDSFDWSEKDVSKIVNNSLDAKDENVILLHDGGGDRRRTVASLPEIVNTYRRNGYEFGGAESLFDTRVQLMEKANMFELMIAKVSLFVFFAKKNFFSIEIPVFTLNLILITLSISAILALALFHYIRSTISYTKKGYMPHVSVLVPAFNEEASIAKTIESLLKSKHARFEIICINNNSTDATRQIIASYRKTKKVRLINEKKQGKYHALNRGVKFARGSVVVVVDADTQVTPNTISEIVKPFKDPKVGGVAGNIKLGNMENMLTSFQTVEYLSGLNIDRRAYDVLGGALVIPGALGAWRKEALVLVGGYKGDTLTEDADATIAIQKQGYKVVFADHAIAYTEAPSNLKDFLKQRKRWTYGVLQVLYKYRNIYFDKRYGVLSMLILPFNAFLVLPFMILSPIVDILTVLFIVSVSFHPVVDYFLLFLFLYGFLSLTSFLFAKEARIWLILLLPLQRIIYQTLWYFVLYRSLIIALRGVFVPWVKSVHYGSVDLKDAVPPSFNIAMEDTT